MTRSGAGRANGAKPPLSQWSESTDSLTLRGRIVRDTIKAEPCERHGKRFWLFTSNGPCLSPDCIRRDLDYWGLKDPTFARVAALGVEDFVSWAVSEGLRFLADCWRLEADAWKPLCKAYLKHRKVEYLRGVKTETEFIEWLHDSPIRRRDPISGQAQEYPDGLIWMRQVANFLLKRFGPPVTALVFECIEVSDLARLVFDGDIIKARAVHAKALEDLRTWHHKPETLAS